VDADAVTGGGGYPSQNAWRSRPEGRRETLLGAVTAERAGATHPTAVVVMTLPCTFPEFVVG
jgi:hypothetical protein